MILRLEWAQETPGDLVTVQAGLWVLRGAENAAFLTNSHGMLMLLVRATL